MTSELVQLQAEEANYQAIRRGLKLMLRRQRRENRRARVKLGWLHVRVWWLKMRQAVLDWVWP